MDTCEPLIPSPLRTPGLYNPCRHNAGPKSHSSGESHSGQEDTFALTALQRITFMGFHVIALLRYSSRSSIAPSMFGNVPRLKRNPSPSSRPARSPSRTYFTSNPFRWSLGGPFQFNPPTCTDPPPGQDHRPVLFSLPVVVDGLLATRESGGIPVVACILRRRF